MDISFIIVNWNTRKWLLQCLTAIHDTSTGLNFEVWLVDNGSSDGSVKAALAHFPKIFIIENNENLGFAAANNQALRRMRGRYAVLINTDAVLKPGAVQSLYGFMEKTPGAAMACGQLENPDGSRQNAIAPFPSLMSLLTNETLLRTFFPAKYPSKRREYTGPIEVDSCIGACVMVRKNALNQVGLLDERYFFFMEETDWALRLKNQGWRIYFLPFARIVHEQGKTVGGGVEGRILFYRARYQFFKKWHKKTYPLVRIVSFTRLVVNALLNLAGTGATLGFNRRLKDKLTVYTRLLLWHVKGCP